MSSHGLFCLCLPIVILAPDGASFPLFSFASRLPVSSDFSEVRRLWPLEILRPPRPLLYG